MGRPKALLRLDGVTFASRVTRTLLDGGCDPVFFVVAKGDDPSRREAEAAGAEVLVNTDPGDGPITSLRLTLQQLDASVEAVAYLPVDHPLVESATVRTLIHARDGRDLVLPVHQGKRGHPAIFGRRLFGELADPSLEGGARTVVHRHLADASLVEVDDAGVILDVDTPEEYAALTPDDDRRS